MLTAHISSDVRIQYIKMSTMRTMLIVVYTNSYNSHQYQLYHDRDIALCTQQSQFNLITNKHNQ